MEVPKSVKILAFALACLATTLVAPGLGLVLGSSKELFGGLLPSLFGEKCFGKLTLDIIAGFATNLGSSAFEKLPEAWSKDHNYDLERALATAYLEALEHLADQETLDHRKEQFEEHLPRWRARIERIRSDASVSALFEGTSDSVDRLSANNFILSLSDSDEPEKLLGDDVEATLTRWASEEIIYASTRDVPRISAPDIDIPEPLRSHLREQLPREIAHRFGQIVRRPDFNRSWIAFQQAHLKAVNASLRDLGVSSQELFERIDDLASQQNVLISLASGLSEALNRSRDSEAIRNQIALDTVERLRDLEENIKAAIRSSSDRIEQKIDEGFRKLDVRSLPAPISDPPPLPAPPADFIGRDNELNELLDKIRTGSVLACGVQGMAGIGKTALALRLASELAGQFPDGGVYLDLRGTSDQPVTSLDAMLHLIRCWEPSFQPQAESDIPAKFRSSLTGKRAVLIWDNAKDVAQVKPLAPPVGSVMIVTSRNHFKIGGASMKDLNALSPEGARELLLTLAPRIGDRADEIAGLCGYLPLALELAASLLADRTDLPVESYVEKLRDARNNQRLDVLDRDNPQHGVQASLQLSYDLLSPEVQKFWRALAVFPVSFDKPAAASVSQCTLSDAQFILSDLRKYSLLEWDEETNRYRLHDLVRDFAFGRANDSERMVVSERHALHYQRVLSLANKSYLEGGDAIEQGLRLFDREWNNIQKGQEWADAFADSNEQAARLCVGYPEHGVDILHLRQAPNEFTRWQETALPATRRLGDLKAECSTRRRLGSGYADMGKREVAIESYQEALLIARLIEDRTEEGRLLGNLGLVYTELDQFDKAMEYYEPSLSIAREIDDRHGEDITLGNIGLNYDKSGNFERALEYYSKGVERARDAAHRRSESRWLNNRGNTFESLGNYQNAIEDYKSALAIAHQIGDYQIEWRCLIGLISAYSRLGKSDEAMEYYEQGVVVARLLGESNHELTWLVILGYLRLQSGEMNIAIESYKQALAVARETDNRPVEKLCLERLRTAWRHLGEMQRTIECDEQMLAICREEHDMEGERSVLSDLGFKNALWGDAQKAISYCQQSLELQREIGDKRGEANDLSNLGIALSISDDQQGALNCVEQALAIAEELGDKELKGMILGDRGDTYLKRGDAGQAEQFFHSALELFDEAGSLRADEVRQKLANLRHN